MNSKEKLTKALEEYKGSLKIGEIENMPFHFLDNMIAKAKNGYYSDYDSPIATPCIQLIKDLNFVRAYGLVELAKNGEFDATQEESDAWYERESKQMIEESGLPKELFGGTKEEKEAKEGIKGWDY